MALKHRLDELYTAHPFYGSRKLTVLLAEEYGPINRKRVQRYMREMGIQGIAPSPNLSKRLTEHRVYPYLLRNRTAQRANEIWGCDITYIRLRHGWLYLVAILDWWSRYVLSWQLDETLELGFVLDALGQARAIATPEIWNTDQGSHFTSPQVTQPLLDAGVQISQLGEQAQIASVKHSRCRAARPSRSPQRRSLPCGIRGSLNDWRWASGRSWRVMPPFHGWFGCCFAASNSGLRGSDSPGCSALWGSSGPRPRCSCRSR